MLKSLPASLRQSRSICATQSCRILVLSTIICGLLGCQGCSETNDKPLDKFVIRLETPITHITSPIDDEGYIDYLEAANVRHAEGVTADNNFEVIVRRVFGPPEPLDEPSQREYYRRLGIPMPNEEHEPGKYFQPLRRGGADDSDIEKKRDKQYVEIDGPWKAADHPELAEWIQSQSKHLDDLVAGSHLPRNYTPYAMSAESHAESIRKIRGFLSAAENSPNAAERFAVRTVGELFGGLPTRSSPLRRFHVQEIQHQYRTIARTLRVRALLRIGENDIEGAQSDLLAIHRIARLLSQGGLGEWLVGRALDESASYHDEILLNSGKLTKETCLRHLQDLSSLPPFSPLATKLDIDSRHEALDVMQFAARQRQATIDLIDTLPTKVHNSTKNAIRTVDWNAAMQAFNERYDTFVKAARETKPHQRRVNITPITRERRELEEAQLVEGLTNAAKSGSAELAQFMGQTYFDRLAPTGVLDVEVRGQARRNVVRCAFAAYLHGPEKGTFPASIASLEPILGEVPIDGFSGQPLRLKTIADGVVIYSVGENRIDDGGEDRFLDEGVGNSRKDDIRIRITDIRPRACWWHARDYGALVANPTGPRAAEPGQPADLVVKQADTLKLRFGVLRHLSDLEQNFDPSAEYRDFVRLLQEQ
jgi:hypothetical protein